MPSGARLLRASYLAALRRTESDHDPAPLIAFARGTCRPPSNAGTVCSVPRDDEEDEWRVRTPMFFIDIWRPMASFGPRAQRQCPATYTKRRTDQQEHALVTGQPLTPTMARPLTRIAMGPSTKRSR